MTFWIGLSIGLCVGAVLGALAMGISRMAVDEDR